MLKKVAIVLVVIVVALLALIASRPATYHVERSLLMPAPAAVVFPLVNDYKARDSWYPWHKLDPNQKQTFSTPSAGAGAWYEWSGNDQVGKGKQIMNVSTENARIEESLEFIEPFASTAKVSFAFTPKGEGTEVTWAMDGNNTFMGKAMSLVVSMDEMIGKDFENGLTALKGDVEKPPRPPPTRPPPTRPPPMPPPPPPPPPLSRAPPLPRPTLPKAAKPTGPSRQWRVGGAFVIMGYGPSR